MNTPGLPEHARLMALVEAHGANLARWPAAERPADAALTDALGRDPVLAAAFDDARALDQALGDADLPVTDDLHAHRLQQRILAALPAQQPAGTALAADDDAGATGAPQARRTRLPGWLRPALAALVPLAIGFSAGVSLGGGDTGESVATPSDMTAGIATPVNTDTQYADETTLAPFLLAANVETMTEEMRR